MGDWIKENKFEATLFGIVLLAVIGAFLVGGKQGQEYQLQKERFSDATRKKAALEGKKPYPDAANEEEYKQEVAAYAKVVEALQAKLLAYRPADLQNIAPSEFTELLNAAKAKLTARYTDLGIEFPADKWHLGFAKYDVSPPRDDATGYLKYQLEAMTWLFESLAEARPSILMNVYRKELPIENGKSMDGGDEEAAAPTSTRGRRSSSRSNRARTPDGPSEPYYRLPVELTFRAPEPALRKFLSDLASNDQHFFVVRTMRVQNEKRDKAPKKDDVEFDAAPAGGGTFDSSFDNELIPAEPEQPADPPLEDPPLDEIPLDDPPADDPPAAGVGGGERILGQVLGREEVFVFLELELLLFKPKDDVRMPEL